MLIDQGQPANAAHTALTPEPAHRYTALEMALSPGTRIGTYEVIDSLGAGGMGEVYRARDVELNRDVALKILPDAVSVDAERLARFRREAQLLAALNHPNIAQVFDAGARNIGGAAPATAYIAMELVPGTTLAEDIDRNGAMPPAAVVHIAGQIAEGLEAAHEAGIIHRDLKPANIKRRDDDVVKILDFGLARALDGATPDRAGAMSSLTMLSPAATQHGVILGTAGYMSPEQAKGRPADKRADIWAFGVVLYEMLAGKRLFTGETVTEVIASVIKDAPALDGIPPETPAALKRLVARCLERDPRLRLRDIGEARILLKRIESGAADPDDVAQPGTRRSGATANRLPWLVAGALGVALVVTAATWKPWNRDVSVSGETRLTLPAPADAMPAAAVTSPDGRTLVIAAGGKLWIQKLNDFEPVAVPGTDGARLPFWAPDGKAVGFEARGQLWKWTIDGGAPVSITQSVRAFSTYGGATWLEDNRIVFATGGGGLDVISAGGGQVEPFLALNSEADDDFHHPSALPGDRGVLFARHRGRQHSLEVVVNGARKVLVAQGLFEHPVYSPTGHIVFASRGDVWALPFSLSTLEVTGERVRVAADARAPSVSATGTLVMLSGGFNPGVGQLTWWDRNGTRGKTLGEQRVQDPRLSPNGKWVAATGGSRDSSDIWVFDAIAGTERRLTFEEGSEAWPAWTPDSQWLVYACAEGLCARRADGSGSFVTLIKGTGLRAGVVTPDGKYLLYGKNTADGPDVWMAPLGPRGVAEPIVDSGRALIAAARFQQDCDVSPDGRYVAYMSAESGITTPYVTSIADGSGRWQLPRSAPSSRPRWSADGQFIFQAGESGELLETPVSTSGPFTITGPTRAVQIPLGLSAGFDRANDGQSFIVAVSGGATTAVNRIRLILNWSGQ